MAIINGDVLRVVASLLFPDDVIMQNVFHLVATTVVGGGDEDDITLDLVGYVDALYANHDQNIEINMSGDEVKGYVRDTIDDDWDEIGTGALGITTGAASPYMPHGCALLQTFFTTDPDVQGRKFWGGFTEANHDDGDWDGTLLTAIVLTAADVVTTYTGTETGSTFQPVVWSPTNNNAYAYSGTVATNPIVAYQRRRKPGVGI